MFRINREDATGVNSSEPGSKKADEENKSPTPTSGNRPGVLTGLVEVKGEVIKVIRGIKVIKVETDLGTSTQPQTPVLTASKYYNYLLETKQKEHASRQGGTSDSCINAIVASIETPGNETPDVSFPRGRSILDKSATSVKTGKFQNSPLVTESPVLLSGREDSVSSEKSPEKLGKHGVATDKNLAVLRISTDPVGQQHIEKDDHPGRYDLRSRSVGRLREANPLRAPTNGGDGDVEQINLDESKSNK